MYKELLEAGGQHAFGFLVATVTNVGYQDLTLEHSAGSVVNSSRLVPVG